jgi:hypothetical protein
MIIILYYDLNTITQVGWFVAKSQPVLQMPSNPSINAAGEVSSFHGDNWRGSLATLLNQQPSPSSRMGYHPSQNCPPTWSYSCRCQWSQGEQRRWWNLCINMTHHLTIIVQHYVTPSPKMYGAFTKVQNGDLFIDSQGGLFPSDWGNL